MPSRLCDPGALLSMAWRFPLWGVNRIIVRLVAKRALCEGTMESRGGMRWACWGLMVERLLNVNLGQYPVEANYV